MLFNCEADFEAAVIKMLSEKGWEKEVLKNYTEEQLIQNCANILYASVCFAHIGNLCKC